MSYPIQPPPTDADLVEFIIEWLAKRERAKVTLTVYKSESSQRTLTIDRREAGKRKEA